MPAYKTAPSAVTPQPATPVALAINGTIKPVTPLVHRLLLLMAVTAPFATRVVPAAV